MSSEAMGGKLLAEIEVGTLEEVRYVVSFNSFYDDVIDSIFAVIVAPA
jgi:hypothetical protein